MLKNVKGAIRAASKSVSKSFAPNAAGSAAPASRWPSDTAAMALASRALCVNEFELFRIAYRRWHGEDIGERALDRAFGEYLKTATAPAWARQLSRDVIERARQGHVDPREFGVARTAPAEDPEVMRACNDIVWLTAIAAFYALIKYPLV